MNDERAAETREWLVEGRVQGVAFRAATRARARELVLDGVAENLADGRVRVLARGAGESLDRLADWLRDGPPLARVDALDRVDGTPGSDPAIGDALVADEFVTR